MPTYKIRKEDEYHIQVAVVQWMAMQYPDVLFTISPSGMKLPISVAVKFKRMGYRKGTSDLIILEPRKNFHGLLLEIKAENGRLSPEQRHFLTNGFNRGYQAIATRGFDETVEAIRNYLEG